MNPLVSVILPCYNSATTLPWAIASLVAQTYEEWECVFVDDGSTDCPEAVLDAFSDKRIRFFRLPKNYGRGAARQFAVEQTRGKYITMLDADDWLFPSKFATQVEVLESERTLPLVSTGMAILNFEGNLVGVRIPNGASGCLRTWPPMRRLRLPPFAFSPTMFFGDIVRSYRFDRSFPIAEDSDLLIRILRCHGYATMPEPLYAYAEYASTTYLKILNSTIYACAMFMKHWRSYPAGATYNCLKAAAKAVVHTAAFTVGQGDWSVRRRSRPPTEVEVQQFNEVRGTVAAVIDRSFGEEKAQSCQAAG